MRQAAAQRQRSTTAPSQDESKKLEFDVPHTKALFTALVAGFAALALHTADSMTKASLGLPLWAGPSAGVCVMFAVAAVTAAEQGTLGDLAGTAKFGVQVALAVTGSCAFAVWACSHFSSVVMRRTVAVGVCALWMLLNPTSAVFPPSAGYCALYIDQLLSSGPMAHLSYTFSVFPCGLGVMTILLATRVATLLGSQPLRMLSKTLKQRQSSMVQVPVNAHAR
eukprot:CAMPEP_0178448230 /NCGR_PEP_ID=MMETSP0689_2-20121128/41863_1 /TAXON_ID=160604 /ORGANISM="Amphidinium massartii, Strain CS-259" /LENGTH=222 /DNA_ID=CAMNT_0020073381 /DNA_START=182 /DNA_END=850 /DNA_ORIENTATION=+